MSAPLRIGVDVDGVLADFNSTFIDRVIEVTGKDLFPARPFDIPTWNYPEHYGYTHGEVSRVWEDIKRDPVFWRSLKPYPHTNQTLAWLASRQRDHGDDVYFITARPGVIAKRQTEEWITGRIGMTGIYGQIMPTVLISSAKGLCAKALSLTHYVDDRLENAWDVRTISPDTRVFLFDQPWNRHDDPGVPRVTQVVGITER